MLPLKSKRALLLSLGRNIPFGILVAVFSLNSVLRHLAAQWPETRSSDVLLGLAAIPEKIYGVLPGGSYFLLELLIRWVLLSLAVFILLLLITAIRHKSASVFLSGISGLLIGLFSLTWISLLVFCALIILAVIAWLFSLMSYIFSAIVSFIVWAPILYTLIGIIVIIGAVALFSKIKELSVKSLIEKLKLKPFLIGAVIAGLIGVVWLVVIPFFRVYVSPILERIRSWLSEFVAPPLGWFFSILFGIIIAIIAIALGIAILFILGLQLCDQYVSAKVCGSDTHRTFDAGFSIGVVMALMLLVCSANGDYRAILNASWSSTFPALGNIDVPGVVNALMPHSAETLLQTLFAKASIPIFDAASLLTLLFLANCSLLMGLVSGIDIKPIRALVNPSRMPVLFRLLFGLVIGFAAMAVDSLSNEDT
jgi:hypothetical protein